MLNVDLGANPTAKSWRLRIININPESQIEGLDITSKKDAFSGSSNLRRGPSSTVNPLLQKMMLWVIDAGGWGVEDTVSPESNLPIPVKLLELEDGGRWSMGLCTAPACPAWLKMASTSLALEGSWTSIPLQIFSSIIFTVKQIKPIEIFEVYHW